MNTLPAWYNAVMAGIVGIHGIAQQFRGSYQLGSVWYDALRDGLVAVGYRQVAEVLASTSYGGGKRTGWPRRPRPAWGC